MAQFKKLLIIGYGNMSGAMLAGWLAAGFDPSRFAVLNRSPKPVPDGVALFRDIAEAERSGAHDSIMLGFKPYQLGELAFEFQELAKGKQVHSLLAGITLAQLAEAFPDANSHIRVMPNLASRINKSPIILSESSLDAQARDEVSQFYEALGSSVWLADETHYDLATALAGSGPGFVYRFIDAMAVAAENLGLASDQARALSLAMVEGASALAAASQDTPGELADKVASPGGMTREGLNVLDADEALVTLLTETLDATAKRGAQLSAGAK